MAFASPRTTVPVKNQGNEHTFQDPHNVDKKRVLMFKVMGDNAVLVYERLIQLHLHRWYSLNQVISHRSLIEIMNKLGIELWFYHLI